MESFFNFSHASLASMKIFNSSNEYSSYFIKWLIGKSLSPNIKTVQSDDFKVDFVKFDDSAKFRSNWHFFCHVGYDGIDDLTESMSIALFRMLDDDDCPGIARTVPIVCRLAIMNKVTGITKYHFASFLESTDAIKTDYKWKISSGEARDLDLLNGDYVVYCWLDIPAKVICTEPPSSTADLRNNTGRDLLSSNIASLFDEVISAKTDGSTGMSDIVLITDLGKLEERRFYCHRAILSARSSVFNTMLTSQFKEANDRDVEIKDIDSDVLEFVLKYIYTGECPPNMPDALIPEVVDVAEKYMLPLELKDECARQLINGEISDDAWAANLSMSITYNIDYLKKISSLALSSNARATGEEKIREKLSKEAMEELANMAAKRWEHSTMMEVANFG